jgi:hypothetical protein
MTVMEETIEYGSHGGDIAEQFAPVLDGTVRGQQGAGAFVTTHDDFQQVFGCCEREFAHTKVIDDQQRDGSESTRSCQMALALRPCDNANSTTSRYGFSGSYQRGVNPKTETAS